MISLALTLACTEPQPPDPPDPQGAPAAAPLPPPPASPGTPKSSAKARPVWAGVGGSPYAPQPAELGPLLNAARGFRGTGALEGGVLVCEASAEQFDGTKIVFGPFQTKNQADLRVYLSFGDFAGERAHSAMADGARNTNAVILSAPLATLERGDPVRLDVYDRDVLVDDFIVLLEAEYQGSWPLVARDGSATATCWALPREEAERLAAPQLQAAQGSLGVQEGGWHPDLGLPDMGEAMRPPRPEPPLSEAAALLGWDDPRVVELNARLDRLRARYEEERLKLLRAAEGKLPSVGQATAAPNAPVQVTVLAVKCGAWRFPPDRPESGPLADGECSVVLRVDNGGAFDLPLSPEQGAAPIRLAAVIDAGGTPAALELRGQVVDKQLRETPGVVESGGAAVLVFSTALGGIDPWLLRLEIGSIEGPGGWALLRLR